MLREVRLRPRWKPRVLSDWSSFLFISFMIPVIYCFEMFVVLPHQYPDYTAWYYLHLILGTFILINLVSNFAATIILDTSTRGMLFPGSMPENWHFCAVCEGVAPPRSRHCHTCRACILKRDHHCMFTGCCVGYRTQRYFISFLLYLSLATIYSTCINHTFIWKQLDITSLLGVLKLVMPLVVLVIGADYSPGQVYLLLYAVNIVGVLLGSAFFWHYMRLTLAGQTSREWQLKIQTYDKGIKANLVEVMGTRWYLAWINPIVPSPLPYDGVNWGLNTERKEDVKIH